MTKFANLVCLAIFVFLFITTAGLALHFSGRHDIPHWIELLFNVLGFVMIGLFPFSIVSLLLTMGWPIFARDSLFSKNAKNYPITWLVWREVRNKKWR
ncbi:hypothetical protein [Phyllobacterium sp. K27]